MTIIRTAVVLATILAASVFAGEWYAKGKSYEKCMELETGFLICRENYVNNFCYGKERVWTNYIRRKPMYDRGEEREWFERKLVAVMKLNNKCEYHGWSKFKQADDKWAWQCYINNRPVKDEDCKGFWK
ncbi:MAG: hypothetical protein FWC26_15520 [Fibromonadales bacterium]|nr:hypothetical protein [Fibromonadales bacterium]